MIAIIIIVTLTEAIAVASISYSLAKSYHYYWFTKLSIQATWLQLLAAVHTENSHIMIL